MNCKSQKFLIINKDYEYNYFYNIRTPKYKLTQKKPVFFVSVEVKPEDKMNLTEIKIEDLLDVRCTLWP